MRDESAKKTTGNEPSIDVPHLPKDVQVDAVLPFHVQRVRVDHALKDELDEGRGYEHRHSGHVVVVGVKTVSKVLP